MKKWGIFSDNSFIAKNLRRAFFHWNPTRKEETQTQTAQTEKVNSDLKLNPYFLIFRCTSLVHSRLTSIFFYSFRQFWVLVGDLRFVLSVRLAFAILKLHAGSQETFICFFLEFYWNFFGGGFRFRIQICIRACIQQYPILYISIWSFRTIGLHRALACKFN